MTSNAHNDNLKIDLQDINVEDIEVLSQEGSRGLPEFAASCCTGSCCTGSCTVDDSPDPL